MKSFPKYFREISNTSSHVRHWYHLQIYLSFYGSTVKSKKATKVSFFPSFSERNINFVGHLFKTDGAVKPWKQLQEEYFLPNKLKFKWIQQVHFLWKPWIKQIFIDSRNSINLAIQDIHLIKTKNIKYSASIN